MAGRATFGGVLVFGLIASLLALPATAVQRAAVADLTVGDGRGAVLEFLQAGEALREELGQGSRLPVNPRSDLRLPSRLQMAEQLAAVGLPAPSRLRDTRTSTTQAEPMAQATEMPGTGGEEAPVTGSYSYVTTFTDVDGDGVDELLAIDVPLDEDEPVTFEALTAATGEVLWSASEPDFGYPIWDDTDVDGDGVLDVLTIQTLDRQHTESDCEFDEDFQEEWCATHEVSFTSRLTLRSTSDFAARWSVEHPSSYRWSYDRETGAEEFEQEGVLALVALRPGEVIVEHATSSSSFTYEFESQIPSVRSTTTERAEAHELREAMRLSAIDGSAMSTSRMEVEGFIGAHADADLGIVRDITVMPPYERTCTRTILLGTECDGEGGPTGSTLELTRWDGTGWTVESDADRMNAWSLGEDLIGGPRDEMVLLEEEDWQRYAHTRTVIGGDTGTRTAATFDEDTSLDVIPADGTTGPRLLTSAHDWQQGTTTLTRLGPDLVTAEAQHTYAQEGASEDGSSYSFTYDFMDADEGGCTIILLTEMVRESESPQVDVTTAFDSLRCDLTERWSGTTFDGDAFASSGDVAGTTTAELLVMQGGWFDGGPLTATLVGGETGATQWTRTIGGDGYGYATPLRRGQILAIGDHEDGSRVSTTLQMLDGDGDVIWSRSSS